MTLSSPSVRVIIPAKNEAATIEPTLQALRKQTNLRSESLDPASYAVTVLANNCTDATADIVRTYAARHPTFRLRVEERHFPPEQANIGTARRTLFDAACAKFEADGIDGIVASTDADTQVAPDWIATTMAEFATGVDAVGGRILLSPDGLEGLGSELRRLHLLDTGYRILLANLEALVDPQPCDPFPRHHQHFGASLAVRVSAYRRAGGIPAVETLEDMAFFERLTQSDARVRHSPRVRAFTSGRRDGRVPMGLSTQLIEWELAAHHGIPRTEESAARSLKRMELVREHRCAWQQRCEMGATQTCGSYLATVADEIEADVQRAVPFSPIPLEQVIQELRIEVGRRSKRSSR